MRANLNIAMLRACMCFTSAKHRTFPGVFVYVGLDKTTYTACNGSAIFRIEETHLKSRTEIPEEEFSFVFPVLKKKDIYENFATHIDVNYNYERHVVSWATPKGDNRLEMCPTFRFYPDFDKDIEKYHETPDKTITKIGLNPELLINFSEAEAILLGHRNMSFGFALHFAGELSAIKVRSIKLDVIPKKDRYEYKGILMPIRLKKQK